MFLGCPTCIFFTENFAIASSAKGSTTYQILCKSVKYFLSYSANRQTDRLTEMKDLIFRNLHGLKYEILKKSRRVIFFRFLYFPYVSKLPYSSTRIHRTPSLKETFWSNKFFVGLVRWSVAATWNDVPYWQQ